MPKTPIIIVFFPIFELINLYSYPLELFSQGLNRSFFYQKWPFWWKSFVVCSINHFFNSVPLWRKILQCHGDIWDALFWNSVLYVASPMFMKLSNNSSNLKMNLIASTLGIHYSKWLLVETFVLYQKQLVPKTMRPSAVWCPALCFLTHRSLRPSQTSLHNFFNWRTEIGCWGIECWLNGEKDNCGFHFNT